ncbi:MAG: glutamate--cysteine ligase [Pseudomonadota bacterium]
MPPIIDALRPHAELLSKLGHGLEKESLRVTADGDLALTPHPESLGSALTHPQITTDFCEAQPELITGVHDSVTGCIGELDSVHRYLYGALDDEMLWTASMPCRLPADDEIPVGRYGTSNIARAKTIYRLGLGHRYGRTMQTISGIHYNFSLPDALWPVLADARGEPFDDQTATRGYLDLIRNFRRTSWLLIYLFGASPAICQSFIRRDDHGLEDLGNGTLHLPWATCLRMGRLGYSSDAQADLHVSYNSLDAYAATIRRGLSTSFEPYEAIPKYDGDEYAQLNTALLQIENEFYGTIRPKRRTNKGERPLTALLKRGVEYVEVRCLDVNPFLPNGIDLETARFVDVFLLYCLLSDSPADSSVETAEATMNQRRVVEEGRRPGLQLERDGNALTLQQWGSEILDACEQIATLLGDEAVDAVGAQRAKLEDAERTPSAMVLSAMRDHDQSFYRFALDRSRAHADAFRAAPLEGAKLEAFTARAQDSLAEQRALEAAEVEPFDEFLERYLALP